MKTNKFINHYSSEQKINTDNISTCQLLIYSSTFYNTWHLFERPTEEQILRGHDFKLDGDRRAGRRSRSHFHLVTHWVFSIFLFFYFSIFLDVIYTGKKAGKAGNLKKSTSGETTTCGGG